MTGQPPAPDVPFASGNCQQGTSAYLLADEADLSQIAADAVSFALSAGADHAQAGVTESGGIVLRAREGTFESSTREGGQDLTIDVYLGGRRGTARTSSLSARALRTAAENAIAIARQLEPDSDARPAEKDWLAVGGANVELFAPLVLDPRDLGEIALEIETAAREAGAGEVRVSDAGVSSNDACLALAIGKDFNRSYKGSRHDLWCSAIAARDGVMAQDWWASADRQYAALESARAVGARAAQRARRKLGGRTLESRTCPVLLDATVAISLVQEITSALTGFAQAQEATFWPGAQGQQVLAGHLDLAEDPFEPFGLASAPFDSEGVSARARRVIRAGVVEDYFLSSLYARKLGRRSTGHADGYRNLTLESTLPKASAPDMRQEMQNGLWVTEFLGGGVNPVTGAYSKAAAGFWIENGEVAFPVQDVTIAGSLPDIARQIVAVGDDIYRRGAFRSASLLIETMIVSGR